MLASINKIKKDEISSSECKSIRKRRNKIVEISAKLKTRNLPKFRFRNLFKSKKIQTNSVIWKSNFLIFNIKIVFTKLR